MTKVAFKNRIVGQGTDSPDNLLANPFNWRIHSDYQKTVLEGALKQIGWIQQIIVNQRTGHIIDGHLRAKLAIDRGEPAVPVIYVDLTEDEEKLALATIDPIAALATTDQEKLDDILMSVEAQNEALAKFLDELASKDEARAIEQAELKASLADQFLVPPFTVLDGRQGYWQERKRAWLRLGIRSELGRGADGDKTKQGTLYAVSAQPPSVYDKKAEVERQEGRELSWKEFAERYPEALVTLSDSIFDPVLAEIACRWFSAPGGRVLDPFAGGSVRGVVAAHTGRKYTGIDIRPEQVDANYRNWGEIAGDKAENEPHWIAGDSAKVLDTLPQDFDLLFSCPPYGDLEKYSDLEGDISAKDYQDFLTSYREILKKAVDKLHNDRFAVWVVGEFRDPKGHYRNFIADTIAAFQDAGMKFYNEAIYLQPIGSLPMRAGTQFRKSRKLGKAHQNLLVFAKGDPEKLSLDGIAEAIKTEFEDYRELIDAHAKVLVFAKGDPKQATAAAGPVAIDEPLE